MQTDLILESAIVVRLMNSFGLFTKEIPTIKTVQFVHPDFPNLWSARVNMSDNTYVCANICEKKETHWAIIKFIDNDKEQPLRYCIHCGDPYIIENDTENYILLLDTSDKDKIFDIHNPSFLIISNLFKGLEEIREYVPHWLPYEATKEDIRYVHEFVKYSESDGV